MRGCSARHCAIWGVRKMGRKETVELTNMCMVEDGKGNVLVQNRLDPNWSGIVYPGGHVEAGESITASSFAKSGKRPG